ncbi:hypothetical protein OS188_07645 [Xanthomarina sp. F1114]|uniref:hypothetical protein n=1 Tax=Xanthomarina sp. F1114 TaxID=2996019 RepID=UPI00225E6803|nr:hypothetical protein [Xanthomarina sp. F1114]MCX7547822.1 hypothetical protein [Xanthomarina sp. F1114]
MKTILKAKYLVLALFVAFSFACSPEDGEPGPQGPAGIDGVDGADGTDGTDGTDGNANVIYSSWFGPDGQTFISNGYISYAEFEVNVPELTNDIINNGVVLVYAKLSNYVPEVWPEGHIAQLPITIGGGTTDHFYTYYVEESNINIRYRRDGPQPEWIFSSTNRFRYVLIPGNTGARVQQIDYSKMTYEEVINHFNLEL